MGRDDDNRPSASHLYGGSYISVEEATRLSVEMRREWATRVGWDELAKGPTRPSKKRTKAGKAEEHGPPNPYRPHRAGGYGR